MVRELGGERVLGRAMVSDRDLREAIRLEPSFAKEHFQLGTVLEDLQRLDAALAELREAARLDPVYPEPHMAMARVLRKLGQEAAAREEAATYVRLRPRSMQ